MQGRAVTCHPGRTVIDRAPVRFRQARRSALDLAWRTVVCPCYRRTA